MSDDYLWDRSGTPDLDIKYLEELLAPLAHNAPLDELRLAKGRQGELVRATAQEPVEAPTKEGRVKGKMNFFDKRIIGAVTLTAAAVGLLGITAYKHHVDSPAPPPWQPPTVALAASFARTPHASPVAPTTSADLAITAGESARIHVPFGAVDVEIQSKCNAEVEMSVVTCFMPEGGPVRPGDPPTKVKFARDAIDQGRWVACPPSESHALGGDPMIAGTDSPDGRASTYRLVAGVRPEGMVQYTSRCVGQPPMHGVLEIDRDDATGSIGLITNARVFDDANGGAEKAIHVFGTVLPGAIVSIGGKHVELQPPTPDKYAPIIAPTFSADAAISAEHPVVAVRIDDAMGTQFYVSRRSMAFTTSCVTTMTEPKQTAAKLDAQGDRAGALKALEIAMKTCKPDRETLSLALAYACKAGDAAVASRYWHKLPPELQRTLEPVCAQNEITRDQLENP